MKILASLFLALMLAACSSGPPPAPRALDLGIAAPSATLPGVSIASVRAVAPFDGTEMFYRLAWRNSSELAPFATTLWAAAPPELLRKQLLRASREGVGKCVLEVEIQEFTQVFSAKEASEARIELRGVLAGRSGRFAARSWSVVEPNAGADAMSGAAAFARAADRAVAELGGWISAQPDCR
jgi:cholesterol transport system auxiliary component